ncbi:protein translocase subunit SecD [Rickettsiales bacterium]|nr:protein translocase subunit SecD [Rickettsiales bacterium]
MLYFSKWKIATIISICIISIYFAVPSFIPDSYKNNALSKIFLGEKISLGLDLRGGSHILLEIDTDYYIKEQLDIFRSELKNGLKEKKIRALPRTSIDKIIIIAKSDKYFNDIKKIAYKINNNIKIEELDKRLVIKFTDSEILNIKKRLMLQSIEIVRRRIDETGTKEPIIQSQNIDRILVQVPGLSNPEQIKNILGKTAKMTFHLVEGGMQIDENIKISNNISKLYDDEGRAYLIYDEVILSGDMLINANATYYEGEPAVTFEFNNAGTKKFAKITRENIGRLFAIVLDNKIITAPRINTVINQGSGVISGNFTIEEAKETSIILRAGALPAPLSIIEERSVGPSLGLDSIKSGVISIIIGFILVILLMVAIYKIYGFVAVMALIVNIAIIISLLAFIGSALTLPGIAGIVLTIGMAVDANVLIFERIKEEMTKNKKKMVAIDNGFSEAFRTIIDSNITTLIVALFLYLLGTGSVKGFAITLSIGILASMFSSIMLTRMLITFWTKRSISR